jgi:mRNA interferase MazF
MKKLMAIYRQFEVVVVPFPFTDSSKSKRRPALIISNNQEFSVDKSILAMITTKDHSPWSLDTEINDLDSVGLKTPSIIRFKLFTLEHALIIRKIGNLGKYDQTLIQARMRKVFNLLD